MNTKNTFATLITILTIILTSCSNDDSIIEVDYSEDHVVNNHHNTQVINLFNRILLENEEAMKNKSNAFNRLKSVQSVDITSFSELFSTMNIQTIKIINVIDSIIDFQIDTDPIYIDGLLTNFNNINYTMKRINDIYYLSNNDSVEYEIRKINEVYSLFYNGNDIDFDGGDFSQVDAEVFRRSQVDFMIMREFTDENIDTNYIPKIYMGTAWGFYTDLATANFLCQQGYDKILNDHPTWCSGGISYSCFFDEHFCTCSANFYEGEECN